MGAYVLNPDVKKNFIQENYQGRRKWQFLTDQLTLTISTGGGKLCTLVKIPSNNLL